MIEYIALGLLDTMLSQNPSVTYKTKFLLAFLIFNLIVIFVLCLLMRVLKWVKT